jgi:hypothetical protein
MSAFAKGNMDRREYITNYPFVSSCLGVKGNVYLGQVKIIAARWRAPFKVHCSQLHVFRCVAHTKVYHYSMTIVCACLSMITTVGREREGEREIKRIHKLGVLCYFKSTTLVLSSRCWGLGHLLFSLFCFFVSWNHQINVTCFLVLCSA